MLVDTYTEARRLQVFEFGLAVNAAMSDKPKEALERILNPPKKIRLEDLHPMIRGSIKKI